MAKWVLPQPPLPPLAMTWGSPSQMSAIIRPVSASFTRVPMGTLTTRSWADFPAQRPPRPFSPRGAEYLRLYLKSARVERLLSP